MTTTERPEIGQNAVANGIRTNYLEDGKASDPTVVLVHGSGPGVTSYANWRLVIPALAEHFHVIAPDMVGFGYSDRPEGVQYGLDTWADQTVGLMDTLGIEKAHLVGNSFGGGIGLRIATKHPDRVDKLVLMGSMGVHFPITEGLDAVWGFDGTLEGMRRVMGFFAYNPALTTDELAEVRFRGRHPAGLPGVVLVDVPRSAPALGGVDDGAGGRDPRADQQGADRARPRGPGDPAQQLLQAAAS